jgi:hypothetical protein
MSHYCIMLSLCSPSLPHLPRPPPPLPPAPLHKGSHCSYLLYMELLYSTLGTRFTRLPVENITFGYIPAALLLPVLHLSTAHLSNSLKVPKREIFVTELIILRHPIWIGDLRTKAKNRFVRIVRLLLAILVFFRWLSVR